MYGNRSILGGLFGAWLGVHVAKRLVGYTRRTGDLFAPAVALGMAIGRIGCLLTETPGTPTGGDWGVHLDAATAARLHAPAGVGLHPSFGYEIAFHAVAFVLLWCWLRHADLPPGETFVLYVAGYGVFRFAVEFVRGNDVAWLGLTRPQLFLALAIANAMVALYIFSIVPEFLMRFLSWLMVHTLYRLRVHGVEDNVPDDGPALIVCNHVSYMDALILAATIPRPVRFVMYYRIFNIPVMRWIFTTAKAIPIARPMAQLSLFG